MLKQKVIGEIISWSKALLIAFSIAIIVNAFIFQPFTVSGSSMEPTLDGEDPINEDKIGDRVLIYKSAYILGEEPKFNDIVIIDSRVNRKRKVRDNLLDSPIVNLIIRNDEKNHWIKRVIGEAGDTIEFKDGRVYRNGTELVENYIKEEMVFPFDTIVVPENYIFVMGDNRNGSKDSRSRSIGPIPKENVLGKVLFRYYPLNKIHNF